MEEESKLKKLKEEYKKLKEEYNLPEFEKLNEDFYIERISEVETEILIREIRRYIAEKLANYMRFLEGIIHPINSPIFIFSIIKTINQEQKNKLTEIYKKLARNELKLIKIDIKFSKENEAEFIKNSWKIWLEIKEELLEILNKVEENWDKKFEVNGNSYFG